MNISGYIQYSRITNSSGLKSTFNQGMGALIWLRQTRQDIGFATTQIATQIVEECESPEKARQLANLYNKIVKFAKNRQLKFDTVDFIRRIGLRRCLRLLCSVGNCMYSAMLVSVHWFRIDARNHM